MKFTARDAVKWVGAYVVLVLSLLVLAASGPVPSPRPFFIEFGVGLGFVGMGILAVQFLITGRFRSIAPVFGADVVLQFHRQAGIVAAVVVLAHPVVLIAADADYLQFFDPRVNVLRALALTAVVPALLLLVATSLWRQRAGLNYEWWRLTHGTLAVLVVFIGMVHGIQVGGYLGVLWKQGVWVGVLVVAMSLVIHSRVIRPQRMKRRPYRVTQVHEELPGTVSLSVEPVGHVGMKFRAGQFAWITVGDSPYSLQQHPFSFSSSERSAELTFTAKAVGDFTSSWADFESGRRVFLEGPYGAFTLDAESEGAVFIAGGIGVTPVMSILRTLRDNGDGRPFVLVYGNPTTVDITFHDEIRALEDALDLVVVHVLEEVDEHGDSEQGYIDDALLTRVLPPDCRNYEYFICGPEPMMDSAERALRDMGVSWRQIYTERFQIV